MSLKDHPYRFFSKEEELLGLWQGTLTRLQGEACREVFGVWDEEEGAFLLEGPLLTVFDWGVLLARWEKGRLALGWNELLPTDPPLWPDEGMRRYAIEGLAERQSLCWRGYPPARQALGKKIESFSVTQTQAGLTGLRFSLQGGGSLLLGPSQAGE